jgi:choline kinase
MATTASDQRVGEASHVVILAAGRGSRLSLGAERPKWLLEIGEGTIAERQLEGIAAARAAGAVASVRVVVGHARAEIEAFLADREDEVGVVWNPEFAELNNWWSLLRALRELPDEGPVLVMNADLLADPGHIEEFICEAAAGQAEALICVDLARELTAESMKVSLSDGGTLARIGKIGIDEPEGEYTGLLMARGAALVALRGVLERFVGRDADADQWYEGAVGRTAADGVAWEIWPMPGSGWVEIDDDDDLDAARALVAV